MSKNFLNSYKHKLSGLSGQPDADVWENISRAINEDMPTATEKRKKKFPFFLAVFSIAALLLFFGSLLINSTEFADKITPKTPVTLSEAFKSLSGNTTEQISKNEPKINTSLASNYTKNKNTDFDPNNNYHRTTNKSAVHVKPAQKLVFLTEKDNHENQATESNNRIFYLMPLQLLKLSDTINQSGLKHFIANDYSLFTRTDSIPSKTKSQLKPKRFVVGLAYIYNNPWLLNHVTFNEFNKNKPEILNTYIKTSVSAYMSFSIKKLTIQMEYIANSTGGQIYQTYSEGHNYKKELLLSYSQFNLMNKFNLSGKQKSDMPSYQLNLLAGMGYGYLNSAMESTNDISQDVISKYSRNNITAITGIEYQLRLKRLTFSSSFRGNLGVNNIYLGNNTLPKELNRAHNSGLSLAFGIGYNISK